MDEITVSPTPGNDEVNNDDTQIPVESAPPEIQVTEIVPDNTAIVVEVQALRSDLQDIADLAVQQGYALIVLLAVMLIYKFISDFFK